MSRILSQVLTAKTSSFPLEVWIPYHHLIRQSLPHVPFLYLHRYILLQFFLKLLVPFFLGIFFYFLLNFFISIILNFLIFQSLFKTPLTEIPHRNLLQQLLLDVVVKPGSNESLDLSSTCSSLNLPLKRNSFLIRIKYCVIFTNL